MALHAAQGPTLGVPQMIQTRGQFGSLGSLLVVGIVIVMYVGFLSSNLVLGGEAITRLTPGLSDVPGIALVGVLSVIAAIFGHDLIHAYARVMTYVSGVVLLVTVGVDRLGARITGRFPHPQHASVPGFLGTVSAARALADRLRALRLRLLTLHAARHGRAARVLGDLLGLHAGLDCCRWYSAPWSASGDGKGQSGRGPRNPDSRHRAAGADRISPSASPPRMR